MKKYLCWLFQTVAPLPLAVLATLVLAAPALRAASAFQNGSFEVNGGNGTSTLTGWTLAGAGNFVTNNEGFTDGAYSVSFGYGNAATSGVLSQTFATVAGQTYTVQVDFGALSVPAGGTSLSQLKVEVRDGTSASSGTEIINAGSAHMATTTGGLLISNTTTIQVSDQTGASAANAVAPNSEFSTTTFTFTALTTSSTIVFTDQSTGGADNQDMVLDNVRITQSVVPVVQFSAAGESVNQSAGTFSVAATLTGTSSTFASGFNTTQLLAFDPSGNLYVGNDQGGGAGSVSKVSPAGVVSTFVSGLSSPQGLVCDSAGNLYVSNGAGTTVSKVTPAGVLSTYATGLNGPQGLVFDAAGILYVGNGPGNSVSKVPAGGGAATLFATGFTGPLGLAMDASGNLYVANYQSTTVSKVTTGGVVSIFASGINAPVGLAFDSSGNLYVTSYSGSNVSRVTPGGTISTVATGISLASGLALDATGNLYVASQAGSVSKLSAPVTAPFTLGGTAVSGTDYTGLTASPLIFAIGQSTATVTGTLPADPGATKTLTFTLGTPTDAAAGSPSVNTLTIVEPPTMPVYATNPAVYTKSSAIATNTPASIGTPTSWTLTGTLPAGLAFSTSTGAITGTPTALSTATGYSVTATNAGGVSAAATLTITVNDVAPSALTYTTNSPTYTKGTAIAANNPGSGGGTVVSYSVLPVLPSGLNLSTSTGIITGTPTAVTASATYTVTATNSGGSTTKALTIVVNDVAPSTLSYTSNSPTYTKGTAITANNPTSGGGTVISYSVLPTLPSGLNLNTGTGVITGTPTAITGSATYTVTATNSGGSTTDALTIAINDVAPSTLTYTTNSPTYTKGTAITANNPSSGGGVVVSYSVLPVLPTGLSLSTGTGIITGTPTAVTALATYTVTATNSGGSTTDALTIAISDVAPSTLTYTTNSPTYTKGTAITANNPSSGGGVVVSYSVLPVLPTGLSLSTSTGIITGTPTAITASSTYTVTATNSGGSTTKGLTIVVNDVAPSTLNYTSNSPVYTKGTAITANNPTSGGGVVVSYSVLPTLPTGLSLSTSTGIITGTPTATATSATYTVTATNSGGSTTDALTITVNDVAPSTLTYTSNSPVYTKGTAITANNPTSGGGVVVSYSVLPTLPTGLSLSTSTGIITGTPTAVTASATYTVTATNSGGSTTDVLTITVNDAAPSTLTYTNNSPVYTKGTAITANNPTSGGGAVTSYSVLPALPTGLNLNTGTGVITGTPTAITASATYTVTATNSGGSTTSALTITVNDVAPSTLTYTSDSPAYTKGIAITANSPGSSGGAVISYSVLPALPMGLSFSTGTGIITGTPTAVTASATYTVTATNSGGSTTDVLTIAINDVAPSTLTYTSNSPTYTKGTAITANSPGSSGGAVISYSVLPALPAGLSLSTSTGLITGTPTAVTASATYTVTATNSGGSTTDALTITVNDVAPSTLTYTSNNPTYIKGTAITANSPASSGGTVVSYSVLPSLPTGLSLSTSTGIITGTPTATATSATYTVTATNSGGSTTDALTIAVNDVAPSTLTYTSNNPTYIKGTAITANRPASSGGTVVSYSVLPTLPAGLSLSTSTGVITGTPTAVTASATYTVTATNSGGSTTDALTIAVNDVAPSTLTYTSNGPTYTKGTAITANNPTSGGGAVIFYSVLPALPAGLSLSTSTGIITGTPTAITASSTYTVTATNSGGSTTNALTITVNDVAPSALTYTSNSPVYTIGTTITANNPTSNGGVVVSYSVLPALPAGLSLSTSTGIITGTPTAVTASATYTVTATNSGGSTTKDLPIAVNDVVPAAPLYATNPAVYTNGIAITPNTPTSTGGGTPTSWTLAGTLPVGLSFSTLTGAISGTPMALSTATGYAVTANNSGGSSTATMLTLTVNDAAPSALTYSSSSPVYTMGIAITGNSPSNAGGAITSYSVIPALPAGLALSAATGTITGTPTVIAASATYTVTGSNTGGSTTSVLTIAINDVPPFNLVYSTNPVVYVIGVAVVGNVPGNSGGTALFYAVSPTLPAGLALDPATGIIGGTPTAVAAPGNYLVTAGNSGGSTTMTLNIAVVAPFALGTTLLTEGPATGTDSVVLAAQGTDAWAADANSTWLHVSAGSVSGTGSTNVLFSFDTNSGETRTGTLTIAGQTLTIIQAGAAYVPAGSLTTLISSGLSAPTGVAVDGAGNVYTDGGSSAIEQWLVATQMMSPLVSSGLSAPTGVAVDAAGNVYLADSNNNAVKMYTAATQTVSTLVSTGLNTPSGVAVDSAGNVYIADSLNNAIKKYTAATQIVSTLVATGLSVPSGVAVDRAGNVYIADTGNSAIKIYTAATQAVSTLVAVGLQNPKSVAVDGSGNVYIADTGNNAIKEYTVASQAVSTLVATGVNGPQGVAVDGFGNVYVADFGNNAIEELPRVFVDSTTKAEAAVAGSDALSVVLPSATNLLAPFGPTSDSPWLTIGTTAGDVVSFSFAANGGAARSAHISLQGQPVLVTQGPAAPSGLTYSVNPAIYSEGIAITGNTPSTSGGGPVVSYSVSPALPTGLVLDSVTGTVSGTATVVAAASNYTVTATNAGGSATVALSIAVADTTPPVLTFVSGNVTVEATSAGGAIVTYPPATATDNVTVSPALTYSQASGTLFALGSTVVTVTATDAAGNPASATFTVLVRDTTPPALTVAANQVTEATSAAGAVVNYPPATATDAVTASPTISYSQAAGTLFALGSTIVTVTATDAASHATTATFTVLVRDTTPPALTVPADQTVLATSAAGAVVTYPAATATDGVTASPTITYSQASGTTFPLGSTTVTVTATDVAGNQSAGTFKVVVYDSTAPVITPPSNVTVAATGPTGSVVTYPPATVSGLAGTTVTTYSQPSGTLFPIGVTTVTVSATDASQINVTATFTVTVQGQPAVLAFAASTATARPVNVSGQPSLVSLMITRTGDTSTAASVLVTATQPATVPTGFAKYVYGTQYAFASPSAAAQANAQFAAGQASTSLLVQLAPAAGTTPGVFVLNLGAATGYVTVGTASSTTVTVVAKDATAPLLTLTSPTTGTVTGPFNVTGTVTENDALSAVTVTLNGVLLPLTTDPTVAFTANAPLPFAVTSVPPENGANTLVVQAVDASGNKTTITKALTFTNSRPALAGTYTALIAPAGARTIDNSGMITVTMTATGSFSGNVMLSAVTVPFTGVLSNAGAGRFGSSLSTSVDLLDKTDFNSYLGALAFQVSNVGVLTGTLSSNAGGGAVLASFAAALAPYSATNPVPPTFLNQPKAGALTKGAYTVVFPSAEQTPSLDHALYPQGNGYAVLTLTNTGSVTQAGFLADGSAYSASGNLRADGSLPLFTMLYRSQGLFMGELGFAAQANSDVSSAQFTWVRPAAAAGLYYNLGWPNGLSLTAVGAFYLSPASLNFGQGAANATTGNCSLLFTDGGLSASLNSPVSIHPTTGAVALIPLANHPYTLTLTISTGAFTGTFTHTNGKTDSFGGVLLNKGANQSGYGYFLSPPPAIYGATGSAGEVMLVPGLTP